MRRLITAVFLTLLLCFTPLAGCKRRRPRVETIEESANSAPPGVASTISMGDPRSSAQLVKGFHAIEQNAWRWTTGSFSVMIQPPPGPPQGVNLVVSFGLPEPVIEKLKSITLSATFNGTPLPAETFSTPGDHIYSKPVPAPALAASPARADFTLDKFLPAGMMDQRELGVVVKSIGLERK